MSCTIFFISTPRYTSTRHAWCSALESTSLSAYSRPGCAEDEGEGLGLGKGPGLGLGFGPGLGLGLSRAPEGEARPDAPSELGAN
jgi:hypothetical protein